MRHPLCEGMESAADDQFLGEGEGFDLRRFAGVSEAGACSRNPEHSEGPRVLSGGGRGIRTPGTLSGTAVFKTARFDRSRIPPDVSFQ